MDGQGVWCKEEQRHLKANTTNISDGRTQRYGAEIIRPCCPHRVEGFPWGCGRGMLGWKGGRGGPQIGPICVSGQAKLEESFVLTMMKRVQQLFNDLEIYREPGVGGTRYTADGRWQMADGRY